MKTMMTKVIATGVLAAVAGTAMAEVEVTADLASAYVYRGVTLNDGAVFQPGIEVTGYGLAEEYGSLTLGAWGNYDLADYAPAGVSSSSFSETDWYVSYGLPSLIEGVDLSIGYMEYSYGAGSSDKEASVGAGYEVAGIGMGLTYYQGVGGLIGSQAYVELALGYELELTEELDASINARLAYLDPASGTSGFSDYDIGASLGYALGETWSLGATLTYIGQGDDDVLGDSTAGSVGYDVEVVGMLGLAASF